MALFGKKTDVKEKQEAKAVDVPRASADNSSFSLPLALVQPRISEKAGALAKLNKYVFTIQRRANKLEVKKAIERKYAVKVLRVNIVNVLGKSKSFGRIVGRTSAFKKAVVTLKQGDRIKGLSDVA